MGFITSLTRAWLTRTTKPFTFKNEYDETLPFAECDNLGLYVHIPFCKSICNFCPYCKTRYSAALCDKYIDALLEEIHMVGGQIIINEVKFSIPSIPFKDLIVEPESQIYGSLIIIRLYCSDELKYIP